MLHMAGYPYAVQLYLQLDPFPAHPRPLAAVADHTPFLLVHDTVSPKKPVMIYRFQAY